MPKRDPMTADTDTAKAIELLRQGTPGPWRVMNAIYGTASPQVWPTHITGPVAGSVDPICEFDFNTKRDIGIQQANARRIAANPLLVEVAAAAAHARSLERAADFKTMEAWHAEATQRYAALDAAIANLTRGVLNNG